MSAKHKKFLEDLQFAYAKVLAMLYHTLVHNDDGGCDWEQVGQKKTFTFNNVLVIYQPIGKEGWIEDGCLLFMPAKESGMTITEAFFKKNKTVFEEAENKFIDSYNGFVSKYGHWIEDTVSMNRQSHTFQSIVDITQPLCFENGKLKMKWTIKALWEGPRYRWYAKELMSWTKTLPAYTRYCEMKTQNYKLKMQPQLDSMNDELKVKQVKLDELQKTQKFVDMKEEIDEIQKEIKELHESKTLIETYSYYESYGKQEKSEYIEDEDEEELKLWYEEQKTKPFYLQMNSEKMLANVLSYDTAFPERKVVGKKRSRE
jgi:hypothetical protein